MYFEIRKGSGSDPYYWRARGDNHEVLCHSENLTSKQGCYDTINVIKQGASGGQIQDETGE